MKATLLAGLLFLMACTPSKKQVDETDTTNKTETKDKRIMDSVTVTFKVTNMLPIGWGTKYTAKLLTVQPDNTCEIPDSFQLGVGVTAETKSSENLHFLKKGKTYSGVFIKGRKAETSYLPAGTTGFTDKSGTIWDMKSIEFIPMNPDTITVTGIAHNAKQGAVVMTDKGGPYYLEGIDSWPSDILKKDIKVTGVIKKEFFYDDLRDEDKGISRGMTGEKITITNPQWKQMDE